MAESQTTALAVRKNETMAEVAKVMVSSKYFTDIKSAEQVLVKLKLGETLGIDPLTAMSQIFFTQGRPCMAASLQARLIKQSGKYRYEVLEKSRKLCRIQFFELIQEHDENGKLTKKWKSIGIEEFGEEDAKIAGLTTGPNARNYKAYPSSMFFARAITGGFRTYCPDAIPVCGTIYLPEEINENVKVDYSSGDGVVVEVDGEIVQSSTVQLQTLVAMIADTATDVEAMKKHYNVADLKDLTPKQIEQAIAFLEKKQRAAPASSGS